MLLFQADNDKHLKCMLGKKVNAPVRWLAAKIGTDVTRQFINVSTRRLHGKQTHTEVNIISVLKNFRSALKYFNLREIQSEADLHKLVYLVLKSYYNNIIDKEMLQKFGLKNFCPDLALKHEKLLIELKFIGPKTQVKDIQDQIQTDMTAYLSKHTDYDKVIFFIYDASQKLLDKHAFDDLKEVEGVLDIIIVPGIGK